jgi:AraC family transcriptional activator of pobA
MHPTSLDTFYHQIAAMADTDLNALLPSGIQQEVGHFNVFDLADLLQGREKAAVPYDRRAYYKNQPHQRAQPGRVR